MQYVQSIVGNYCVTVLHKKFCLPQIRHLMKVMQQNQRKE